MLEQFERLMRESGEHETYLDNKGDLFWPVREMRIRRVRAGAARRIVSVRPGFGSSNSQPQLA